MRKLPAIMVAGVSSGCGKTTVTLGLMAAFRRSGIEVQPFKCGPDFIDPTLHFLATGSTSWNLDLKMCPRSYVARLFHSKAVTSGINVIEGVMGLFDGAEASGASLSAFLDLPVVLVVDASSSAESVAAIVHGFETFSKTCRVEAVILNRVASKRHEEMIRRAITKGCRAEVVGAIRRNGSIEIPSRHLGLHMGHEPEVQKTMERLAETVSEGVDLAAIERIAKRAGTNRTRLPSRKVTEDVTETVADDMARAKRVRIGVAMDSAFCFYYQDNLELLQLAGAEIVPFSPLHDERLPSDLHGLILGGGYPELYAGPLEENRSMREQILWFCHSGRPVLAECGGFMYLCQRIVSSSSSHEMVGLFPATCSMQKRLAALGYRSVRLARDCPLGPEGLELKGHEFHYSTCSFEVAPRTAFETSPRGDQGVVASGVIASYVHLHFGSNPGAALNFVDACWQGRGRSR